MNTFPLLEQAVDEVELLDPGPVRDNIALHYLQRAVHLDAPDVLRVRLCLLLLRDSESGSK